MCLQCVIVNCFDGILTCLRNVFAIGLLCFLEGDMVEREIYMGYRLSRMKFGMMLNWNVD